MKTAIVCQFDNFRWGVFDRNGHKAHLPTKTFQAYNQVSMTFFSKVLFEKGYFGQFDNFRSGVFDRYGPKAHLRTKTLHLSL